MTAQCYNFSVAAVVAALAVAAVVVVVVVAVVAAIVSVLSAINFSVLMVFTAIVVSNVICYGAQRVSHHKTADS